MDDAKKKLDEIFCCGFILEEEYQRRLSELCSNHETILNLQNKEETTNQLPDIKQSTKEDTKTKDDSYQKLIDQIIQRRSRKNYSPPSPISSIDEKILQQAHDEQMEREHLELSAKNCNTYGRFVIGRKSKKLAYIKIHQHL